MLDEIAFLLFGGAFARLHADHALAAAPLCAKRAHSCALDKAAVGDADNATLVRNQVFDIDLCFVGNNFRQARRTIFVANFAQLFFDDAEDALFLSENIAQIVDGLDKVLVFIDDFFALEPSPLLKAQIENFGRLLFAKSVTPIGPARRISNQDADLLDLTFGELERQEFYSGFVAIGRSANNAQEFIEVGERNQITFERFGALFGLAQLVSGAAQDDFAPMIDVNRVGFVERQQLRPAVIDRQHRNRKRTLQRGVLVEIGNDDFRVGVAFELDDNARVFIRLIANIADVGQDLLVYQLRDPLD